MQKLKYAVLDQMIQKKLTSSEINFLIHISHFQDDSGSIYGIYYQDIMKELGISTQKFYDILTSLKEKEIIRVEKNFYSDWDIQIRNNDFTYPESFQEGYLNMQHNIFHSKEFYRLRAGEKLLAMLLLKIGFTKEESEYTKSGSYVIGVEKFYDKYREVLSVTKRAVQKYLTRLRKWFSIGIKKHLYYITPLARVYRNGTPKDAEIYQKHIGGVACRRSRLSYTEQSLQDTVQLATQFEKSVKAPLLGKIFLEAVSTSIAKANERIKNPKDWKRILQPKLVNKCITEKILALGLQEA